MKNANTPAMPLNDPEIWVDSFDPSKGTFEAHGLTKREYFAGLAMQALLSDSSKAEQKGYDVSLTQLAQDAVAQSDALLAELNTLESDHE